MDDRMVVFFVAVVAVVILVSGVFSACEGVGKCFETVRDRPCLPNTIDFNDGECKCLTKYGELEWNVSPACDWD